MNVTIKYITGISQGTEILTKDGQDVGKALMVTGIFIAAQVDEPIKARIDVICPMLEIDAELEFSDEAEAMIREMGWEKVANG